MSIIVITKAVAAGAASAALAATALVGGTTATQHLSTSGTSGTAAAAGSDTPIHCRSRLRFLHPAPGPLRSDLKALRALPKGTERRTAAKKIRAEALAGGYGTEVQKIAESRRARRAAFLADTPAGFRTDREGALTKPPGKERRAALEAMRAKALDGGYGAEIQQRAQQRREHRATCRAQRAERQGQAG